MTDKMFLLRSFSFFFVLFLMIRLYFLELLVTTDASCGTYDHLPAHNEERFIIIIICIHFALL